MGTELGLDLSWSCTDTLRYVSVITVFTRRRGKSKAEIFLYQFNLDLEVEELHPGCTISWVDVSAECGAAATGLCFL